MSMKYNVDYNGLYDGHAVSMFWTGQARSLSFVHYRLHDKLRETSRKMFLLSLFKRIVLSFWYFYWFWLFNLRFNTRTQNKNNKLIKMSIGLNIAINQGTINIWLMFLRPFVNERLTMKNIYRFFTLNLNPISISKALLLKICLFACNSFLIIIQLHVPEN